MHFTTKKVLQILLNCHEVKQASPRLHLHEGISTSLDSVAVPFAKDPNKRTFKAPYLAAIRMISWRLSFEISLADIPSAPFPSTLSQTGLF